MITTTTTTAKSRSRIFVTLFKDIHNSISLEFKKKKRKDEQAERKEKCSVNLSESLSFHGEKGGRNVMGCTIQVSAQRKQNNLLIYQFVL